MSLWSHGKLIQILRPIFEHAKYNSCTKEPTSLEHIGAIGLQVLSGGRVKDQCPIAGTSLDAAYKIQSF